MGIEYLKLLSWTVTRAAEAPTYLNALRRTVAIDERGLEHCFKQIAHMSRLFKVFFYHKIAATFCLQANVAPQALF